MAWFMVRSFQNKSRCHPSHFAFGSLSQPKPQAQVGEARGTR
jgi:hypothetical protein